MLFLNTKIPGVLWIVIIFWNFSHLNLKQATVHLNLVIQMCICRCWEEQSDSIHPPELQFNTFSKYLCFNSLFSEITEARHLFLFLWIICTSLRSSLGPSLPLELTRRYLRIRVRGKREGRELGEGWGSWGWSWEKGEGAEEDWARWKRKEGPALSLQPLYLFSHSKIPSVPLLLPPVSDPFS